MVLSHCLHALPGPEEPASFTLSAVTASAYVQLTFNCASRAAERPWTPQGPPIQFVHIPKAGGTSLNDLFGYGKPRVDMQGVKVRLHNFPGALSEHQPLQNGTVHLGHQPVGWGASSAQAKPLYIVVLREPLGRAISLYDHMATSAYRKTRSVRMQQVYDRMKHLQTRAEPAARKAGVPSTHTFEWLLARNDPVARHIAFNDSQLDYLVPAPHNRPCTTDLMASVRVAAHVLLRADVVAVTEEARLLEPQLQLHAPTLFGQNSKIPHSNSRVLSRLPQELRNATAQKLRAEPLFQAQALIHDLAQRLARARAMHAQRCLAASEGGEPCAMDCSAHISVEQAGLLGAPVRSLASRVRS